MKKYLVGILLISVPSLCLWNYLVPNQIAWCFSKLSYYLILSAFGFWITAWIRWQKASGNTLRDFTRKFQPALLLSLLLALIAFLSVKPYFRILSDETNLLGVSKSMTEQRTVDNPTMGKWYYYNFNVFNTENEKRPLLYPFFVHLLHLLRGYDPANAFAANFLILWTLLFLVFYIARLYLGTPGSYTAMLLAFAQPVLVQTATSGGFDLLFVCFALISFTALHHYLEEPSAESFGWLWANLLMLANTRHESLIFIVLIPMAVFLFGPLKGVHMRGTLLYAATPVILLSRVWQHILRMQLSNPYETPGGAPGFGWHYFLSHQKTFLKTLIDFHFFTPYATVINLAGLATLGYLIYHLIRPKQPIKNSQRRLFWISLSSLAILWGLITGFHMGDLTHPTSARYFLLFFILFSIMAAVGLERIFIFQKSPYLMLVTALIFTGLYHTQSVENRFSNTLFLPREYRFTLDFLKKAVGHHHILVIADRPGQYTVQNYGAVDFAYANEHAMDLLEELDRHLFTDIYVIQEILYETGAPAKETVLAPAYPLKTVFELQNKAESFVRISKVQLS